MTKGDRKKQILEHLNRSSELDLVISAKKITSPSPETFAVAEVNLPIAEIPAPSPETSPSSSTKKDVMAHLNRSSADFGNFNLSSESRKKQILEHLRQSIS